MKRKLIYASVVILTLFCSSSFADSSWSAEKKLNLFRELTSKPKTTWIQAGSIEATKEEYRAPKTVNEQQIIDAIKQRIDDYTNNDDKPELTAQLQKNALDAIPFNVRYNLSNEYTMKSSFIIRYDSPRYYCDITVNSRQDSIQLPQELKNNSSTEEYNLNWNGRRILCFDGQKNIIYTPAINHAMIDSSQSLPQDRIDLLTIGIVPWGYNYFSYDKLSKIQSSAVEKTIDGRAQVQLNLITPDNSQHTLVLDPEKGYSPITWVIKDKTSVKVCQYDGYKFVSGSWAPTSIVIEKFDAASKKLLAGDYVNITAINGDVSSPASFTVSFGPDTSIEYLYDLAQPELIYYNSNTANTELLLAERMAYMASEGKRVQNCATEALQYAALQLGKDILNEQLSQLVNPVDNTTSLGDLKKYAENLGFKCKAVKTNLQSLQNMKDCKAILHIPGTKHFVLLDKIDQKYVWLIDLSRDKFYYRSDVSFFGMSWTEGTALLISNQSITLPADTSEIPENRLAGYIGGSGWLCTLKLQTTRVIHCLLINGLCYGIYQIIIQRYGCVEADSGECPESYYISKYTWPCVNDPWLDGCAFGERTIYYTLACQ